MRVNTCPRFDSVRAIGVALWCASNVAPWNGSYRNAPSEAPLELHGVGGLAGTTSTP